MVSRKRKYARMMNRNHFTVGGREPLASRHTHYAPFPPVNIKHHKDYFDLDIAIPGFNEEDISVEVLDGILTVKGLHKESLMRDDTELVKKEYDLMSFERTFQLTEVTDQERIEACYENGVLRVRLHHLEDKAHELTGAHPIPVH